MHNNIKINEKEAFELYEILLIISSKLTVLSSLDNEILYNSEFISGIKDILNHIKEDVEKCIKLTNL